ncbi:MAG: diacylglycerol kinase [Gammaproteobacteria bacterium]|jgi:diacylglycerol kinase (ATP)|uniref:Diacylglycerol kinase n=1 Tax=Rheinheimera soli TaxID=443616 RepID=A0ABU1VYF7_9GAMM|nr:MULTISPECIES: diacylglycerol kinase [Rheinheimera]MBU1621274.1 diacylglycerol kinase [Gammaproteobacteria bacterium]EGM76926.1 diacylglycerol kinase [Rheinheimera sp. A13L]MBU2057521.1 diacylglycerol kinase [Gammaproteobacteria bacterium]MBU2176281.1 diacylglycerol kinase [Gammaproteobacteria bacterium]MBU2245882.1 diacylglycerol kinase [Gammaproteobacteria bacterium]
MNKPNGTGFGRIIKAADCSRKGFAAAWVNEAAFRQEAGLTLAAIPFAWYLAADFGHFALLMGVWLLVIIVELLNSAIEALTDRVSLERHELSGRAKDMGSAAVTSALVFVALVWAAAIWQKFS